MTELRDLLERAAGPEVSGGDVATAVGADLARGRRALRRRTTARAVAGVAVVGALALVVPRVLPTVDGGGDAGPAGQGPSVSVTQGQPPERPAAEVYAGVEAALAERGLAVPPHTTGSPLRWTTVDGGLWFSLPPGAVGAGGVEMTPLLPGKGLRGDNHGGGSGEMAVGPQGLHTLGLVLQRVSQQPVEDAEYCALIQPERQLGYEVTDESIRSDTCVQRGVDSGTLFVTESGSDWNTRYVTVGLVRDDATAVSVTATVEDDFGTDVLVDLAQDPRLRW